MFMIVKYGESREQFFNTECKTRLLLKCIKEKCDSVNDGLVDLADENGEIMFLHERADHYGNEFLKPRSVYVLLRKEKCDMDYPLYTPLLQDERLINDNFLRQLKTTREQAMKKYEVQRSAEVEKVVQGPRKVPTSKRTAPKDPSYKRTQSLLIANGIGRRPSKARPSR